MSVPQVTYSSLKSTVTSFCRNFYTTHSQSFCNPTGIPTGKKWTPKLQSDCLVKKQTNKDLDIAKKQWLSTAPWRQAVGEPVVSVYTWELAHKTAAHSRLLIRGGAPSTGKCAWFLSLPAFLVCLFSTDNFPQRQLQFPHRRDRGKAIWLEEWLGDSSSKYIYEVHPLAEILLRFYVHLDDFVRT